MLDADVDRAGARRRASLAGASPAPGRRFQEAADAWRQLAGIPGIDAERRREALEALAIHHEHRAKDLEAARAFAMSALQLAERCPTGGRGAASAGPAVAQSSAPLTGRAGIHSTKHREDVMVSIASLWLPILAAAVARLRRELGDAHGAALPSQRPSPAAGRGRGHGGAAAVQPAARRLRDAPAGIDGRDEEQGVRRRR